jgi:hypothetical protein
MSHYIVAVITENEGKDLDEIMAPFEEKEVPRYVKYTKEQAIEHERKKIQDYKNGSYYQEYLKDPAKYLAECKNEGHAKYISEDFPKRLEWTDEELYAEAIKYENEEDIGSEGEIYSTYNPLSKWDYYTEGGRWDGCLPIKIENPTVKKVTIMGDVEYVEEEYTFVNSADLKDVAFDRLPSRSEMDDYYRKWAHIMEEDTDYKRFMIEKHKDFAGYLKDMTKFSTYAIVTPDGNWHEPGKMGWWGMSGASDDDEEKFKKVFFEKYIKPYLDKEDGSYTITMVDCHI